MLSYVRYSLVALTAVVVLAAPAPSLAKKSKRSGSDTQFVACVKNKNGVMLFRPASTTGCKKGWKKIWWNTTGPQGPAGKDGTNGTTGSKGDQGPQGLPGAKGTDGANGTNGSIGPQGPAGTNGTNGTNGVSGLEIVYSAQVPISGPPATSLYFMTCPSGKRPISGGWQRATTGLLYVVDSFPTESDWVFAVNASQSLNAIFYVVCANAS